MRRGGGWGYHLSMMGWASVETCIARAWLHRAPGSRAPVAVLDPRQPDADHLAWREPEPDPEAAGGAREDETWSALRWSCGLATCDDRYLLSSEGRLWSPHTRQATRGFAAYGARWAAVRGAGLVNLTFAAGLARATVSIPPRVFYAYQSLVGGVPVAVHARRRGLPSLKTAWDYYCLAAPLVPELRVHGKAHVHPDLWRVLASMRGDARLGGRLRLLHPPVVRRLGRDVPMQELRFARACFV